MQSTSCVTFPSQDLQLLFFKFSLRDQFLLYWQSNDTFQRTIKLDLTVYIHLCYGYTKLSEIHLIEAIIKHWKSSILYLKRKFQTLISLRLLNDWVTCFLRKTESHLWIWYFMAIRSMHDIQTAFPPGLAETCHRLFSERLTQLCYV